MEYNGDLSKMRIEYEHPIHYYLSLGDKEIFMNDLINHEIKLVFSGTIHCVACGRTIKKAYGQGFCYPCFIKSPLNSECILKPELCRAHLGEGRDPEWEEENHNKPHYVYLALTSDLKVGVTRMDQIPIRWVDQGAWKAIKLALTPYRYLAGLMESDLKSSVSDKTPWQKMLTHDTNDTINLAEEKERVSGLVRPEFREFLLPDENEIYSFEYPVVKYPEMVKSINFDKQPDISGTLTGIRGQYLIFDDNRVLNFRRHSGYAISLIS